MKNTHTLIQHRDIRNWVSNHKGMPALATTRNSFGELRAKLGLSFERRRVSPRLSPEQDDGMTPCSWTAWLAELDRQQLALQVSNRNDADFEFIRRQELSQHLH